MNEHELINYIEMNIKTYERRALKETDIGMLHDIYQFIVALKIIQKSLFVMPISNYEREDYKGRIVVNVNAENGREALAALDILRKRIAAEDYQYGQRVEEQIYVTNEGCAWSG